MEGMLSLELSENGCKSFEMWSHCNFLNYAFPLFIDRIQNENNSINIACLLRKK